MARVVTVRQQEPLGLGHAVLCAKALVGDEPFVVMLGDDIIDAAVPATRQLADCWARHGMGTIALMEVPREETSMYGIAAGAALDARTTRIEQLVEKPKSNPPSNLAVIGRYVLPPRIFELLEQVKPGVGGEIQLTDALAMLAQERGAARLPVRGAALRRGRPARLPEGQRRLRAEAAGPGRAAARSSSGSCRDREPDEVGGRAGGRAAAGRAGPGLPAARHRDPAQGVRGAGRAWS